MKKYNAFQIKLFMAFLMVFDHIHGIPGLVSPTWEGIFHVLTRCVAVWFAYAAVEGFVYTRDRLRYNGRLYLWAGIMMAGSALLGWLFRSRGVTVENNIFLSLALGETALNALYTPWRGSELWSPAKQGLLKAGRAAAAAASVAAAVLYAEGGILIVPFMIFTYLFRGKRKSRNAAYILMSAALFAISFKIYPTAAETADMLMYNSDWMFITVIPVIALYDGQRGPNGKFNKYFFYVFYPAHLWLIAAIAYFVK